MKVLSAVKDLKFEIFPPGYYYYQKGDAKGEIIQWYQPTWYTSREYQKVDYKKISETFEKAVVKRLMSDRTLGVFLSGGLDSSLVAAIVKKHIKDLHSFSVGIGGESSDIIAARKVADFLGTHHHEKLYTF